MNTRSRIFKIATEWSEDLVENQEEKQKVTGKSSSKENESAITKIPSEQSDEHSKGLYVNTSLITPQIIIGIILIL